MKAKQFLTDMAKGAAIGVAMIIPGVSGGTLAVLLGVYDTIIESISGVFKSFKRSVAFLLPFLLGAVLAFVAAYYPLKLALGRFPLPTVLLFCGLMLGSFPKMVKDVKKLGFKPLNALSFLLPLGAVIGICFIPHLGEVDLTGNVNYFYLILMGALASCALVVPGISGSMLLLIFGYYKPLFGMISALRTNFGHSLLVLLVFAFGVVVGFFTIAQIMKLCMKKLPRGTSFAILGFVVGSFPAIFITFNSNFADVLATYPVGGWQIAVGAVLCAAGAASTFLLTVFAEKHMALRASGENGCDVSQPGGGGEVAAEKEECAQTQVDGEASESERN